VGVAYFAPYGVGLGHASRLVMVADQLQNNDVRVRFSSFGEAASYITMRGYECATVAPVEFAWSMEGGFSITNSLANIPLWFANFFRQVNQETRNMTMFSPDIIVSDSRLSPLLAAKLLRIPSIVILNQVKLLLSPRLRELAVARLFEKMVGELLGSMWNMADRVLIPDLPPPYTISAHNVWEVGSTATRLEYIGFTSPKPFVTEGEVNRVVKKLQFDRSRPVVFIHVSGPAGTRMALVRVALEASKMLDSKIQFVISEGNARGSTEPRKVGESGWYYEWCPVRDEIFAMSELLVLRGGHVALSEAIQFGRPVVTVPIENHGEQLGNSAKIAELGMGVMLRQKGLKAEQLASSISEVLGNPQYRRKAAELQKMTENLNGIENVVQIVRSYL
jgi:UDP-N-acetylglucosamine--N-acetylmuramyl-(pentapeptide) pyrophosphoryl-undecaprenol N-acetylglucosamine transferase